MDLRVCVSEGRAGDERVRLLLISGGRMKFRIGVILTILLAALSTDAMAQALYGSLTGNVTDDQG